MKVAKVNFNDCIGADSHGGGISEQFVRYSIEGPNCLDPALAPTYPEAVELHFFNCPGGEVHEGYAIYAYLRTLTAQGVKVSAYVHGLCASIASVIVLAADERYTGPLGSLMIHKPLVDAGPWANADDHRRAAADLDRIEAQISAIYASRTHIAPALLPELMRAETTFGAAEAMANGFATALLSDVPAPVVEKAKKILNYASPKPLATMATLNETEKNSLFGEFKNWLMGETPKAEAPAAPVAETPAPVAPAPDPTPTADASGTEVALSDGTSIFVDTSDDGIADIDEGDAVFADQAMTTPVADGDYTLEDSRDFTVAGGVVTVLAADPAAAAAPVAPAPAPVAEAPRPMSPQARLKVAEARAEAAEARLRAHVPGAGNPVKPGAQAFADAAGTDNHPLAGAAQKVNNKLHRGI